MAFPSVINSANTTAAPASSQPLTMPASIVAGRLLLAICGSSQAPSSMTGWTHIGSTVGSGANQCSAWGKIAAGSDTGTLSFGLTSGIEATTYQVDSWSGTISDIGLAGTSANADPPSLTMGSSADYLWFACWVSALAATGAPTSYTNLTAAGSTTIMNTARRALTATSEDPAAFTGGSGGSTNGVATIAVAPVAATLPASSLFVPRNQAVTRSYCY